PIYRRLLHILRTLDTHGQREAILKHPTTTAIPTPKRETRKHPPTTQYNSRSRPRPRSRKNVGNRVGTQQRTTRPNLGICTLCFFLHRICRIFRAQSCRTSSEICEKLKLSA